MISEDSPEIDAPSLQETNADVFFRERLVIMRVSKAEFVQRVREKFPTKEIAEIEQTKGINFEDKGKIHILLRTDVFPEEYLPFMEAHEKWEAFVAHKEGFNLFKMAVRVYVEKTDKIFSLIEMPYSIFIKDYPNTNMNFAMNLPYTKNTKKRFASISLMSTTDGFSHSANAKN